MNGGVGGGSVGGSSFLVLLHFVVLLKVAIILFVILVNVGGVLLSGLGEVDDLATGAGGDNIVQINSALGAAVILVIVLVGCAKELLDVCTNRVVIGCFIGVEVTYHPQQPVKVFVSKR